MISVTQLRQGATFLYKNQPHIVVEYSHTHMGRGGGTIKVKVKNLRNGATTLEGFKSGDRVEDIAVRKKQVTFLYTDADSVVVMDPDSYDQISIDRQVIGDKVYFLQDGMTVWLRVWEKETGDEVLDIELPASLVFTVADAAPGEKGNSASNMYKDGKLENGMKVRIPLFVNPGDKIKVSTLDGSYLERA